MNTVPGPRTSPTVKPLIAMNRKNLRNWEIRLGLVQMVALLGLITGSMACAFYLGFYTGRNSGFDAAMASTVAGIAPFPIEGEHGDDEENNENLVSEVYAKLNNTAEVNGESAIEHGTAEPKVDAIKSTTDAPVDEIAPPVLHKSLAPTSDNKEEAPEAVVEEEVAAHKHGSDSVIRSLSDVSQSAARSTAPQKKGEDTSVTLGALLPEKETSKGKKESLPSTPTGNDKSDDHIQRASVKATEKTSVKPPSGVTQSAGSYVKAVIPPGWFAQVAAPKNIGDANTLAGQLSRSGFPVVIENAKVRGQEYFRVLVGPEGNRGQADRLIDQLKRERYLKGDPFIRMVK